MIQLFADENTSLRFVTACRRLRHDFPIVHVSEWEGGRLRESKDPAVLQTLRIHGLVLVTFDRRTMTMHAGELSRAGTGHAGVILFRRSIAQQDFGKQARVLVEFWREAAERDWTDRIQYLPR